MTLLLFTYFYEDCPDNCWLCFDVKASKVLLTWLKGQINSVILAWGESNNSVDVWIGRFGRKIEKKTFWHGRKIQVVNYFLGPAWGLKHGKTCFSSLNPFQFSVNSVDFENFGPKFTKSTEFKQLSVYSVAILF